MNAHASGTELVIAIVSPVGVNLDDLQSRLRDVIDQHGCSMNFIHLSELAQTYLGTENKEFEREADRLDYGMKFGNEVRERHARGDIMALLAIKSINAKRMEQSEELDNAEPLKRTVHVIRSLKHPDEVELLRAIYGRGLFILGVSSTIQSRKFYLTTSKDVSPTEVDRFIERDDKESLKFGQKTQDVFELADGFVTTDNGDLLLTQLSRFFGLLFSDPVVPPTEEEYAMFMAYAASLRSADLARQVGAVVVGSNGDIISTGANDVPKFGGGLYWPGDGDQRDYILGKDSNEIERVKIAEDAVKRILGSDADEVEIENAMESLSKSKLMGITEYGRAVHAEMEALLHASRNGSKVLDGKLYTTTYPCHNCAKHIVAAGIKEVVYIEPYPKSYANILHSDAISDSGEDCGDKVKFRQFVGIGPRPFVDLFSTRIGTGRKIKRKHEGKLVAWDKRNAELRVPMLPLSYIESEIQIITELNEIINGVENVRQ